MYGYMCHNNRTNTRIIQLGKTLLGVGNEWLVSCGVHPNASKVRRGAVVIPVVVEDGVVYGLRKSSWTDFQDQKSA